MGEKILFLGQIFEIELLMNLRVFRFPQSKNLIFSGLPAYVCGCRRLCVCVCVSSLNNSQINNTRNSKLGISDLCNMDMVHETFYEEGTIWGTQNNSIES